MVDAAIDALRAHQIEDADSKAYPMDELTASRDRLIERLCLEQDIIDANRRAKDILIAQLSREIEDINAGRAAKDELMDRLVREIELKQA
jgi:hypothetical protein